MSSAPNLTPSKWQVLTSKPSLVEKYDQPVTSYLSLQHWTETLLSSGYPAWVNFQTVTQTHRGQKSHTCAGRSTGRGRGPRPLVWLCRRQRLLLRSKVWEPDKPGVNSSPALNQLCACGQVHFPFLRLSFLI